MRNEALNAVVAIAGGLTSWLYLEFTSSEEAFWPPQLAGLLLSVAGMLVGSLLPQWFGRRQEEAGAAETVRA